MKVKQLVNNKRNHPFWVDYFFKVLSKINFGEIDIDQWKMPQSWHKDLALVSDQSIKLHCFIN